MIRIDSRHLRLAAALLLSVGVAIAFERSTALRGLVLPLQEITARVAAFALNALGMPVVVDGVLLTHAGGFRAAVSHGCTPILPVVFLGAVMTFGIPLRRRTRVLGLLSGAVLLTLINLLRVIALFSIGVVAPGYFVVSHEWLGQGVVIAATALIAGYWIARAVNPVRLKARP